MIRVAGTDSYAPASDSGMIHVTGTDSYAPATDNGATYVAGNGTNFSESQFSDSENAYASPAADPSVSGRTFADQAAQPSVQIREDGRLSQEEVQFAHSQINKVVDNVETAIIGKRTAVELVFLTMLARGHALLEDVPGVGKTSLVSAIAKSVDCDFKRIQFTPDLMPSDITGFSIYNQKSGEFEFRSGAAMSNIVLAD